jgi:hypothetical protein
MQNEPSTRDVNDTGPSRAALFDEEYSIWDAEVNGVASEDWADGPDDLFDGEN